VAHICQKIEWESIQKFFLLEKKANVLLLNLLPLKNQWIEGAHVAWTPKKEKKDCKKWRYFKKAKRL